MHDSIRACALASLAQLSLSLERVKEGTPGKKKCPRKRTDAPITTKKVAARERRHYTLTYMFMLRILLYGCGYLLCITGIYE